MTNRELIDCLHDQPCKCVPIKYVICPCCKNKTEKYLQCSVCRNFVCLKDIIKKAPPEYKFSRCKKCNKLN